MARKVRQKLGEILIEWGLVTSTKVAQRGLVFNCEPVEVARDKLTQRWRDAYQVGGGQRGETEGGAEG